LFSPVALLLTQLRINPKTTSNIPPVILFINGNACLQISQDGGKLENVAPAGEAAARRSAQLPIVIKSFYTALFTCLGVLKLCIHDNAHQNNLLRVME
jgi:hypothetical protein